VGRDGNSLTRVTLAMMSRALASCVVAVCVCASTARADSVETGVRDLSDGSYKVRLAAALALSKSRDPRAVIGLAESVTRDDEPTIRRVAALALERMVDARTADDARELAIAALEKAATTDVDDRVRESAAKALKALAKLRRGKRGTGGGTSPANDKPSVFVNVDDTLDQSKRVTSETTERLSNVVKRGVESRTGYATSWPGGLPTSAELSSSKSRAFIVASTVKKIDIRKTGHQTAIACTVAIRIAPWSGRDGGEKWEANKVASASGSAKATTGLSERDITGGVRDCLEAVAEDVTARQVVPFLKRLATAGS
jgi:hypothetical protein